MSDETRKPWVPRAIPAPHRQRSAPPEVDRRRWTAWSPPVQDVLSAVRSELTTLASARQVRELTPAEEQYEQHLVVREQELLDELATRRAPQAASLRRRLL